MLKFKNNNLFIENCNCVDLAKEYGTPLYVVSKNQILSRIQELNEDFIDKYPHTRVAYAAKAFFPLEMARIIKENGLCVDVVSGGELFIALKAGIQPEDIEFNGNNKSKAELKTAIENNVGRIIINGIDELELLDELCNECRKPTKILFRITPGVESNTHEYMVTGKEDSKFGINLSAQNLEKMFSILKETKFIEYVGIHFHVGSQIFENDSYLKAVDITLDLIDFISKNFNFETKEINLGGGFGVTYTNEERKPFSYYLDPCIEKIHNHFQREYNFLPNIVIEPGRSLVGEAGITLYEVGCIKDIPGVRKYVSVDGGMSDNIRPALYGAQYSAVLASDNEREDYETITISGKCCESGDLLIKNIEMPKLKKGDLIAVLTTGAYCYSMSSNYNMLPIPGVVMVDGQESKEIVKRQTYEDLIINQV